MEIKSSGVAAARLTDEDLKSLIDPVTGTLDAKIYTDPEIYKLELERIFGRTWQFLGHVDQIPKFGDFIRVRMGEDSVIVARHKDKGIRAFLNQCRHRGNFLARADRGNAKTFTCSYHGWCHDTSGRLVSVPHEEDAHHNALDKEQWSAIPVPRVEIYKGLIFGNWDADAVSLEEALGDAAWYLDAIIDRGNGGIELCGPLKWRVAANWKWQAEQHASDYFHAPVSHNSALSVLKPENAPPVGFDHLYPGEEGYQFADPDRGHGTAVFITNLGYAGAADNLKFPPSPGYEYFSERVKPMTRAHLGEVRADRLASLVMTIFPNMSINMAASYLRIWQPCGPNEVECLAYGIVDKGATEEEKEAFMRGLSYSFTPHGFLEQDDTEAAVGCQSGVSGFMASKSSLNIQAGIGYETTHPDYKGSLNYCYSDHGARAFYSHWQDLLSSK